MIPRLPKGFTHPVKIGGGGFASVYRVRQITVDRFAAIKIISEPDRKMRQKLLKEAKTQAGISIACIPHVFDAFEWQNHVYIVMEWIRGVGLHTLSSQGISPGQGRMIAGAIINALAQLHTQGYAHRDIKPQNIMIDPRRGVFLIDFGLTKNTETAHQTMANAVKGTPYYMAPEQWTFGANIDPMRSDIYSLGKVLCDFLPEHSPDYTLASGCTARKPGDRPRDARALLDLWNAEIGPLERGGEWQRFVGIPTQEQISDLLFQGSRQLLQARRCDEAYELLTESLEENADNSDAIECLATFPSLKKKYARQNRLLYLFSSAAVVVGALILGFLAGWYGINNDGAVPFILTRGEFSEPAHLLSEQRFNSSRIKNEVSFKLDSLQYRYINGSIIIRDIPATGTLKINGRVVRSPGSGVRNIPVSLAPGMYLLEWYQGKEIIEWREHIELLPFQHIAISLNQHG